MTEYNGNRKKKKAKTLFDFSFKYFEIKRRKRTSNNNKIINLYKREHPSQSHLVLGRSVVKEIINKK